MALEIHRTKRSFGDLFTNAVLRVRKLFVGREVRFGRPARKAAHASAVGYSLSPRVAERYSIEGTNNALSLRPLKRGRSGRVIFYVHGGGYWHDPSSLHFAFLRKLCERTGACAVMPVYPKAPAFQNPDMLAMLRTAYNKLLAETTPDNIILAGDSAGAALGLSLVQALPQESRPKKLLLLSPGCDCTLSNPCIEACKRLDPMLSPDALKEKLKFYYGELDPRDPAVSPLFGPMQDMPPSLIISGTHDVLYPDILVLEQSLSAEGASTSLHIFPKMIHTFSLIPITSAYSESMRLICEFIEA